MGAEKGVVQKPAVPSLCYLESHPPWGISQCGSSIGFTPQRLGLHSNGSLGLAGLESADPYGSGNTELKHLG